jgi:uncharacterized membrane protein
MENLKKIIIENKWLLFILLVSTILRFYNLDFQSLWMDEIYTMNISNPNFTLKEFHSEMLLREGFPYLYYILIKISYFFFGYSAYVARGFSAVMGVLSVYAIYILGKELSNKKTGLIAAVLLAINEYCIYISQDARLYTLYLLITIFSFYRLILFVKSQTIKNTIWYGISAGLLISVNFFGFINLLSQSILVLYFILISEKEFRRKYFLKSVLAALIAIIIFLPNYDMLLKLLNFQTFWVPKPTNDSFSLLFKEFLGNSEMTLFIFTPLFFYYLITLFQEKTSNSFIIKAEKTKTFSFFIYFVWCFGFIFFLMVKSYGEVSLILTRYFTSIIPVIILILATSIGFIKNKFVQIVLIITITLLTFSNLFVVKKYYKSVNKAQFREASNFVIENHKNNEKIYTSQKYWFDYYFKNDNKTTNIDEIELEGLIQQMKADSTKITPFWYIDAFGKTFSPSEETNNFISQNFHVENNYDGFQAWTKHFVLLKDVPKIIDLSKYNLSNQYNGDTFMFNIEVFETLENNIKISGWAYFDKQNATKTTADLVLIKEGSSKGLRLQSQKVNRPDVTTYFKNQFNVDNAGFNSIINTANLETGNYKLAIYLKNEETKKVGLVLTDKTINK